MGGGKGGRETAPKPRSAISGEITTGAVGDFSGRRLVAALQTREAYSKTARRRMKAERVGLSSIGVVKT